MNNLKEKISLYNILKNVIGPLWNKLVLLFVFSIQIIIIGVVGFFSGKILDIGFVGPIIISAIVWFVTLMSTILFAFRPLSSMMSRYNDGAVEKELSLKKQIANLSQMKDELNSQIEKLVNENRNLEDEVDTMKQTQQFVPEIQCDLRVQAFTVSKSGYVVKREKLDLLRNNEYFVGQIPDATWWQANVQHSDRWRVFYAGKHANKYEIGIDLNKVKFAVDKNNTIYLKGVQLERLNRIAPTVPEEFNPNNGDINHTWIVDYDTDGDYKIINDRTFLNFKNIYEKYQNHLVINSIQCEIDNLCKRGTTGLQQLLKNVYRDNIKFINEENSVDSYLEWRPITNGLQSNVNITRFVADLLIAFNAINLYTSNNEELDNALNPVQLTA